MKDRKYFSVIDGIIAGEGQGPFCPNARQSKVLIGGDNLLATDIVAVRLIGLDPMKIKYLEYFISAGIISVEDIEVISELYDKNTFFSSRDSYLNFQVPEQWKKIKI